MIIRCKITCQIGKVNISMQKSAKQMEQSFELSIFILVILWQKI